MRVIPLNIPMRAKTAGIRLPRNGLSPDHPCSGGDAQKDSSVSAPRAVSLDTGNRSRGCLLASCVQVNDRGRLPRFLSSLENHTQPVAPNLRGALMDSLVAIRQPTRVVTGFPDTQPSYFPDSLSLPPVTFELGQCNLTQPASKTAIKQETSCKTIDLGTPKDGSLGHQIISTNLTMVSSGVAKDTMQTNEHAIARIIQGNVAAIRRTDNTVIKKIHDQLAANRAALDECKMHIDNIDARAASLDAMTDRIQTLTSNATLQELCIISKDQEEIDRIVAHIGSQLDKTAKSFDEAYALAHEFVQRVAPYRTQLPVFEKLLTLLTLKQDAIRNKARAGEGPPFTQQKPRTLS